MPLEALCVVALLLLLPLPLPHLRAGHSEQVPLGPVDRQVEPVAGEGADGHRGEAVAAADRQGGLLDDLEWRPGNTFGPLRLFIVEGGVSYSLRSREKLKY